jgi:hypothetical protein
MDYRVYTIGLEDMYLLVVYGENVPLDYLKIT